MYSLTCLSDKLRENNDLVLCNRVSKDVNKCLHTRSLDDAQQARVEVRQSMGIWRDEGRNGHSTDFLDVCFVARLSTLCGNDVSNRLLSHLFVVLVLHHNLFIVRFEPAAGRVDDRDV